MEEGMHMLRTGTQEPHMPARLYYRVYNQRQLIKRLDRLRCLNWYDDSHFAISYYKEAKHIQLPVEYQDVPPQLYPVNLAHGQLKSPSELILDLRSFERAARIAEFMDKHIDRAIIRLTHVATYNAHLRISKTNLPSFKLDFDELFAEKKLRLGHYGKVIASLEEIALEDIEEIRQLKPKVFKLLKAIEHTMPILEKFTVNYPVKGKLSLDFDLMLRFLIALKRPVKSYQAHQGLMQRLLGRWQDRNEAEPTGIELE